MYHTGTHCANVMHSGLERAMTDNSAGFYFGLTTYLTGSDGSEWHAPQPFKHALRQMLRRTKDFAHSERLAQPTESPPASGACRSPCGERAAGVSMGIGARISVPDTTESAWRPCSRRVRPSARELLAGDRHLWRPVSRVSTPSPVHAANAAPSRPRPPGHESPVGAQGVGPRLCEVCQYPALCRQQNWRSGAAYRPVVSLDQTVFCVQADQSSSHLARSGLDLSVLRHHA